MRILDFQKICIKLKLYTFQKFAFETNGFGPSKQLVNCSKTIEHFYRCLNSEIFECDCLQQQRRLLFLKNVWELTDNEGYNYFGLSTNEQVMLLIM